MGVTRIVEDRLNALWYKKSASVIAWVFIPLSMLYALFVYLRRQCFRWGIFSTQRFSVPVIVVGNLTVGGTGKTPLVMHIVRLLQQRGFKPGIISRGYGGSVKGPLLIEANTTPLQAGDEAVLLATRLKCPVMVSRKRCLGIQQLLQSNSVDVVISDDGLQHYEMGRDIEIVVIDGERRFGNGHCLPIGPLRELPSRLNSVDLIISNGGIPEGYEYDMWLRPHHSITAFKGKRVHAVAGIGNPKQFFTLLTEHGIDVIPHAFPDHHLFKPKDIHFEDSLPVILTEKDAIKCYAFMDARHFVLAVDAKVNPLFDARLLSLLQEIPHG